MNSITMSSHLTKTLYDKRWFAIGWSAVFALMVLLVVLFFPSFRDSSLLDDLSKTTPKQLQSFVGDAKTNKTVPGYIAKQLYEIRVPLFMMIMALVLAQAMTVGEEERGVLRTATVTPVSRSRLLWERWLAAILVIGTVVLATVAGTYLGLLLINEAAPHEVIFRLALQSWLFGSVAFSLPYAVGMFSGHRAATMSVGLFVTVGSFILSTFAVSVDWLEEWERLSLLYYYDTGAILDGHFNTTDLWLLFIAMLLALTAATFFFRRRDIA